VNPSCPSCRAKYKANNIEFTAPSDEEVARRIESKRKNMKKSKKKVDRERLSKMRILQRNLVYVTNLPVEFGTEEILSKPEFFGQYGKIKKVAINRALLNSSMNNNNEGNHKSNKSASVSAYVTFANEKVLFFFVCLFVYSFIFC
jgi:CCR4-NOT transcription complex subunit 4